MAVKFELDKKKDQLVPYAALDAFANGIRQKLTTPSSFEKLFTKKEKLEEKKQRIEKLAALIEGLPKNEGRYWFVDLFLAANDGKADDLAKDLFKDLTKGDAFKELEKATSAYNANFKEKTLAVAKASDALTKRVADAMTPVAGAFGKEFKERILTQPAQAAAPAVAPAAAPQPTPAAESIDRELYQSKKLLELGFITENEYLAKLVETKNILEKASDARRARRANDPTVRARAAAMANPNDPNELARRRAAPAATPTQQNAPQTGQPATTAAAPVQAGTAAPQTVAATQPAAKAAYTRDYGKRDIRRSVMDAQKVFDQVATQTDNKVTKQTWKAMFLDMLGKSMIREDANDDQLTRYGYTPDVVDSLWNDYISKDKRNVERLDPREVARQRVEAKVENALQQPEVRAAVQKAAEIKETDPEAHEKAVAEVNDALNKALDAIVQADPAATEVVNATKIAIKNPEKVTPEVEAELSPAAKKIIQAADPSKPTAVSENPKAADIASAISTLVGQKQNDPDGELVKLAQQSGATQQAFTDMEKGVVAESLTSRQQQLVKLQVKKQVLAEYVKTGEMTTKTQLNEFFLTALILAALAGVIAWATSKLWPMLQGAVNGAPASGRSRGGDPVKDTQNLVQSLGGGYNSQGQYVDVNGKAVPDVKTQIGRFKADLQEKGNVIAAAAKTAIDKADNNVKALVSFQPFQQTFTASPQTEINAVITALDEVAKLG
jgi:hypothetical protein